MFYKTFKRTAIRCIYHMVSKNMKIFIFCHTCLIEKRTLIPAEAISKFRELTAARTSAIGQQLFQMKKIPGKRGIDYSREDVEKIFIYLRGEIDKCESEFIKKFDEKKADKFKVTKNPRTPAQPESLYLGYPRI